MTLGTNLAERSEAQALLDTTRTSSTTEFETGLALSSACPRQGSVLMQHRDKRVVLLNTNCNSWRCRSCRDRNLSRFKSKVSTGISRSGRCAFITITYKADGRWREDALSVSKDWKALQRRLTSKASWVKQMAWLRVMELTKKGTPHHHLVIGPVPESKGIRCWRRGDRIVAAEYLVKMEDCECLVHTIAREWYAVTGDSLMVHGIPVTSSKGAGVYLAKYMQKEFDSERAEVLGMARRWSTSRGWPGSKRLRLCATSRKEWERTSFRLGHVESDIEGGPADLLEREGDSLDVERARELRIAKVVNEIKRGTVNVTD